MEVWSRKIQVRGVGVGLGVGWCGGEGRGSWRPPPLQLSKVSKLKFLLSNVKPSDKVSRFYHFIHGICKFLRLCEDSACQQLL